MMCSNLVKFEILAALQKKNADITFPKSQHAIKLSNCPSKHYPAQWKPMKLNFGHKKMIVYFCGGDVPFQLIRKKKLEQQMVVNPLKHVHNPNLARWLYVADKSGRIPNIRCKIM